MPNGHARAGVLTAFACWLVFLASGDDFNVARIALLALPVPSEDLLPLDDPNSDFTESSQSQEPTTTSPERRNCTSAVRQPGAGAVLNSQSIAPMRNHSPRHSSNAPLRC